ncbi:MAG: toxin-antitoxin system YwqK family antitoxin [Rikenellaceae bacterium]|nr:toxin-antitoxin system YwqK family antitoxin [Rikenellaceae bacterium]
MRKLLFSTLLSICLLNVSAQNEIVIEKITVINYGDGRFYFTETDTENALQGERRIIDGYNSAYILAEFKDGFYNGTYKEYHNNNLITEGNYTNGVPDGMFKDYYPDGETLKTERPITNGKVNGLVRNFRTDDGVESEKSYKNGVEDGIDRLYNSEGVMVRDCNYKDGKPEGRQDEYFTSNRDNYRKISNYKDGLLTGEYSETLDNGVVRLEGNYVEGQKDGKWTVRRKEGIPEKEENYKAGKLDGISITYYTDGTVEKEQSYKEGKLDGVSKTYHWDTGKLKTEYTYKEGKKEGPYKICYDDDSVREEGECENDTDVLRRKYRQDGTMTDQQRRTRTGWETVG